jgi:hypothetical protein
MFEPSTQSYAEADYSQLATSALEIGGGLASQAIAQSGHGKRRKHKVPPPPPAVPEHSPMWPIAIGLGALAVVGFVVLSKPKPKAEVS